MAKWGSDLRRGHTIDIVVTFLRGIGSKQSYYLGMLIVKTKTQSNIRNHSDTNRFQGQDAWPP